jgi:hypothetical protein
MDLFHHSHINEPGLGLASADIAGLTSIDIDQTNAYEVRFYLIAVAWPSRQNAGEGGGKMASDVVVVEQVLR